MCDQFVYVCLSYFNDSRLLQLQCTIATPLDDGQSLVNLCSAVQGFMPENFTAALGTFSAVVMGANYTSILKMFGCCGVPILTGPPGSCKSEASKCALSLYGAHESHTCNNQTMPRHHICSKPPARRRFRYVSMMSLKRQQMLGRNSLSMRTMARGGVLVCME